jgi:hypothetical protein
VVVQQLRRMVADLLKLGHRRENVAPSRYSVGVLDLLHHVVAHRLANGENLAASRCQLPTSDIGPVAGARVTSVRDE